MPVEPFLAYEGTLVCLLEKPALGRPAPPCALFGAFSRAKLTQASCLRGRTNTAVTAQQQQRRRRLQRVFLLLGGHRKAMPRWQPGAADSLEHF